MIIKKKKEKYVNHKINKNENSILIFPTNELNSSVKVMVIILCCN